MHGDGSAQHLVSAKLDSTNTTRWSADAAFFIMVDSVSKVKHHSVPILEALGMLEGTIMTVSYLADNFSHISSTFPLTLNIGCDSTCTLYNLRINKIQKNVLIKNLVIKLKNFWTEISLGYHIQINVYFINSSDCVADLNSKITPDPIQATNSSIWRHGLPQFLDHNYPDNSRVFTRVTKGEFIWNQSMLKNFEEHTKNCTFCSIDGSLLCGCSSCSPTSDLLFHFNPSIFNTTSNDFEWKDGFMLTKLPEPNYDYVE